MYYRIEEKRKNTDRMLQGENYRFGLGFFKRIFRLFPWFFPSFKSLPVLLFILLLCLGLLEEYVIYHIGHLPSKYYKVLGGKDSHGFWRETAFAAALIVSKAFITATEVYIASLLYIIWRQRITSRLHSKYFQDVLYYTVNVLDKRVDNTDQRITQDVDKLCDKLSKIMSPILISPFTIAYYLYKSNESSGAVGPIGVVVFFIIATVINKILMSPVVKYVFIQEKMEGNFRFKHMQIRSYCESAAFYRSGKVEEEKTNRHLKNLVDTQYKLIRKEYPLKFSVDLFDYLGSIFSYIAISVPIFFGTYDSLSAADLSALISANAFVVIYLINCFTKLIDLAVRVTDIAGTTHRVAELVEALQQLLHKQREKEMSRPQQKQDRAWSEMETLIDNTDHFEPPAGNVSAFTVSDLAYTAPNSNKQFVKGLCFRFQANTNILVTGNSGCGKSSLLRVLNGLWPEVKGSIENINLYKTSVIMFLPQKPYLTDGSLRQQIIHPRKEEDIQKNTDDDDTILTYLEKADLSHICDRTRGLDVQVDWNWYDELSPGEMQRLSFVRLFYHNPKFAVMDESTSQIGLEAERTMYTMCRELGITFMSVGHRDSLKEYHDVELHLEGNGGWRLTPILDNESQA